MSYNIEGHASLIRSDHIEKIAESINSVKPDIVVLNEVHRRTWQSRFKDHVEQLRLLTHMNAAFGESYQMAGGQFGNAILTRGQIMKTDIFKLPGVGEPRSLLKAIIRIDGGEIDVFGTHLTAWGGINSGPRTEQLQCLVKHVRASPRPHILAGDLNAPPESAEVSSFQKSDAMQICGADIGPTQRLMNERIDYIFADHGWQVRSARTLDIGPSDHRPVIAELVHVQ